MYGNDEIISHLQANKILALKLDHAVTAVGQQVANQVETLGKGATRLLYYTSCFTDEYNDVCQKQKTEDLRFRNGVIRIIQNGDVVYNMLHIYFEEIFKYKTNDQLEYIKKQLMAVNVHIRRQLTYRGRICFSGRIGLSLSVQLSSLTGRAAGTVAGVVTTYGLVQKAVDSAHRLSVRYPAYYAALYAQELEMMYFLIEPVFERAGALEVQWSDSNIASIITRMIR
ncbi:LOW QUALITY PROTEIN: hypothetical protein Rahaq2_0852 [Rahnella aquatilis CIP 78.65 = ATCC 33071]|uniref:Uncharacterized protein n=1 Tax=Rahnella aquatilis (strain ATCC 33071 / DSM 4594 / JCM 1683 / NBRC 105701 / NCIMB 13365 / CIP 78.65) TaxID=745277 RepID=H2IWU7_RAHAC|nr:LOW QUALITY PROTEIN: hypothetical protein Rahaq2_0852 [Rahnella aquatilis CIP 78.65 = ATCC 33071]